MGQLNPLSHLETTCLETRNVSAACSCDRHAAWRADFKRWPRKSFRSVVMCIPVLLYSVAQTYNESNPLHAYATQRCATLGCATQRKVAQRQVALLGSNRQHWKHCYRFIFFNSKRSATVAITKKCHYYSSCAATSLHGHHGIDRASPAP